MGATVVFAIAAHPDDIEFMMAGTLLLLRQAGAELHVMNVANGSCGSMTHSAAKLRRIRRAEAQAAAKVLGAEWHPSLAEDMEVVYNVPLLRKLAAVLRNVRPDIVLTHSALDYMEDHVNTGRLAVSAAFSRCLPNFRTTPPRSHYITDTVVYHSMPHGLRDPLRRKVTPGLYVNTTSVQQTKLAALACHHSQQEWLDQTQKMNSYLRAMDELSRETGRMSKRFRYAEGWWRHLPAGFCAATADPLRELLGPHCFVNPAFEAAAEIC